ncbi:MAG: HEAT repeat domain-containing protein [Candidatus Obscuribacterales bacterium]
MFPHEHIQTTEDRSWTLRLVEAISTAETKNLEAIKTSLIALSDPRSFEPLTAMVLDTHNLPAVREATIEILLSQVTNESQYERTKWWHTGDEILKHYAAAKFERTEIDLIETILTEPESPYFADAISAIENTQSEEVKYQQVLIEALKHADADVRLNAASALVWQEPVEAEELLIEVGTNDSDLAVAEKALDTLAYFRSRKALARMNELRESGRSQLKDSYENTFKWLNDDFVHQSLTGEAAELFSVWLAPVKNILEYPEQAEITELRIQNGAEVRDRQQNDNHTPTKCIPTIDQIRLEFGDFEGEWAHKRTRLYGIQWEEAHAEDRSLIAEFLCSHQDVTIRESASRPCALWGDTARLLGLSYDPILSVRKSAAYEMRLLPPCQMIAERLWQMFIDSCTTYVFCYEALESYVIHESKHDIDEILLSIAQSDKRPTAVYHAIYLLQGRQASKHLKELVPLLKCPPINNWAVHIAILDSCRKLGIETGSIADLAEVDNLDLQISVCETLAEHG